MSAATETGYRENVAVRLRPFLSKNVLCLQCAVPESKSQTHKLKGFQLLKDMASRLPDVDITVEPHHLFRYPSEWDPRVDPRGVKRNNTKGGYLEGSITLPVELRSKTFLLRLSTVPDYTKEDEDNIESLLEGYSREEKREIMGIHPTIIAVIRKGHGMRRDKSKEPVPNKEHNPREFLVQRQNNDESILKICNIVSQKDEGRKQIFKEDIMFPLEEENGRLRLKLGRGNRELNLVVLIPKTEARCGEEDISMDQLLEQRLPGERYKSARTCLKENLFTGRRAYNLKKARIRVEVLSPNRSEVLASGTSRGITDTGSKTVGALDIRDAHPLVSCERGGRKVIMVSEFKDWDKSVKPFFQLSDSEGNILLEKQSCVVQPTEIDNDGKVVIFLTPAQTNVEEMVRDGRRLSLFAKRERDDHLSIKHFSFKYKKHRALVDPEDCCLFCESTDLDGDVGKLPSAPITTGPNLKRRRMSTPAAETHVPRSSPPSTLLPAVELVGEDLTDGGTVAFQDTLMPLDSTIFNSTSDSFDDLFDLEMFRTTREEANDGTMMESDNLPSEDVQHCLDAAGF